MQAQYYITSTLAQWAVWTLENRLKLNNEMTEFIVFTSERQRYKVTPMEIGIDRIKVEAADDIKYVGMWLNYY